MHELAAHTGCPDGPCPDLTRDQARGMTGGQGYVPLAEVLGPDLPPTPEGEVRWEMASEVFEDLLAQYLTDDAIARILALRAGRQAAA